MKRQHLSITIIDRRHNPPRRREKHFIDHKKYLGAMGQIAKLPDVHLDEETQTTVILYPQNQGALFEEQTKVSKP